MNKDSGALGVTVSIDDIRAVVSAAAWLDVDITRLGEDQDLFASGLTSHGSVHLMLALEVRFGMQFPDHLVSRATFRSLASIQNAIVSTELRGAAE